MILVVLILTFCFNLFDFMKDKKIKTKSEKIKQSKVNFVISCLISLIYITYFLSGVLYRLFLMRPSSFMLQDTLFLKVKGFFNTYSYLIFYLYFLLLLTLLILIKIKIKLE